MAGEGEVPTWGVPPGVAAPSPALFCHSSWGSELPRWLCEAGRRRQRQQLGPRQPAAAGAQSRLPWGSGRSRGPGGSRPCGRGQARPIQGLGSGAAGHHDALKARDGSVGVGAGPQVGPLCTDRPPHPPPSPPDPPGQPGPRVGPNSSPSSWFLKWSISGTLFPGIGQVSGGPHSVG